MIDTDILRLVLNNLEISDYKILNIEENVYSVFIRKEQFSNNLFKNIITEYKKYDKNIKISKTKNNLHYNLSVNTSIAVGLPNDYIAFIDLK